jgi:hypothetical protein
LRDRAMDFCMRKGKKVKGVRKENGNSKIKNTKLKK